MADPKPKDPSLLTVGAIAWWMIAVCLMQWMLYGPHVDLETLTNLPLGFVLEKWLPFVRELLTAPLGT